VELVTILAILMRMRRVTFVLMSRVIVKFQTPCSSQGHLTGKSSALNKALTEVH